MARKLGYAASGRSPAHQTRSLTLVEVVASLALLGGTVATLLVAQSGALEQLRAAQDRREAGALARGLLQDWRLAGEDLTAPAEGAWSDRPAWSWRRLVVGECGRDKARLVQVRVEVVHTAVHEPPRTVAAYDWLEPLRIER
ncbi:MAG: hypothetical protein GY842_01690 [bacterium]|nr:hypothetical protein [bacterium]